MRVLVTGGTGFLGKNIQEEFNKHPEVAVKYLSAKECNLVHEDLILPWVESNGSQACPDVIIHLAARCGGILANKNSPATFLRDNLKMGLNIYELARNDGVKRVYSLGSVCSYPVNCPTPFREDDIWNGSPEATNAPYGEAKRALMMLSKTYREQYGIGGAFFIPVNMYGPHDHFDLVNSHVVPALINKFVTAVEQGKSTVECWGTGTATRELFYVADAAEAIVKAVMCHFDTEKPINLGTGSDISIKDLACLIGNLVNFKGEIVFTGEVSDGQPVRRLDVSRAKELLGWEAKTKLVDGLQKTIQWYKDNK